MRKIPRCMSTQHPDNVTVPFFSENSVLAGEDEIKEAYYVFSSLECDEQMWDFEGKEVDAFVVKKLFSKYEHFFRDKILGEDVFLTFRVPNPEVEKAEAKVLLETLESIPRCYDAAKLFYEREVIPVFEVILPMTTSSRALNRVYHFYRRFISGRQWECISNGDIEVHEWIGDFKPEEINVIPLIEDMEHLLKAHTIVGEYVKDKSLEYQRVFLARSDPALNYGLVSAVLLNKIALQRLAVVEEEESIPIYPIIGVGAAPFRGNFRPDLVENCLAEYPSVQTFTIQSAFKYDFSEHVVRKGVEHIKKAKRRKPLPLDEERCLELLTRFSSSYIMQLKDVVPLVSALSKHVPSRRARRLHIGLFGYSREVEGFQLPRAITFCAALYSMGLPPELLGISALSEKDLDYLSEVYKNFHSDMAMALRYFNKNSLSLLPDRVSSKIEGVLRFFDYEVDEEHSRAVDDILQSFKRGQTEVLTEKIARAAWIRHFLG